MPLPKTTLALTVVLVTLMAVAAGLTYYQQKRQPVSTEVGDEKTVTPDADSERDLSPTTQDTTSPSLQVSPTPTSLKPDDGVKGTYSTGSKGNGPAITQVTFDPLDVKKGQKLTITVTVGTTPAPADKVVGSLQMDNGLAELTFAKTSSSQAGDIWQTNYTLTDSVNYKYILTVTASAGGQNTQTIVAPRS